MSSISTRIIDYINQCIIWMIEVWIWRAVGASPGLPCCGNVLDKQGSTSRDSTSTICLCWRTWDWSSPTTCAVIYSAHPIPLLSFSAEQQARLPAWLSACWEISLSCCFYCSAMLLFLLFIVLRVFAALCVLQCTCIVDFLQFLSGHMFLHLFEV